jgi:hypothetical protein
MVLEHHDDEGPDGLSDSGPATEHIATDSTAMPVIAEERPEGAVKIPTPKFTMPTAAPVEAPQADECDGQDTQS